MGLVVGSILMFKVDTDYDNSSLRNLIYLVLSLVAFYMFVVFKVRDKKVLCTLFDIDNFRTNDSLTICIMLKSTIFILISF